MERANLHLRVNDLLSLDFKTIASIGFLYCFYERTRGAFFLATKALARLCSALVGPPSSSRCVVGREGYTLGTKEEKTVAVSRICALFRLVVVSSGTQKGLQFPNQWMARLVGVASTNGTGYTGVAEGPEAETNGVAMNSSKSLSLSPLPHSFSLSLRVNIRSGIARPRPYVCSLSSAPNSPVASEIRNKRKPNSVISNSAGR